MRSPEAGPARPTTAPPPQAPPTQLATPQAGRSKPTGLTTAQAAARLSAEGFNELPGARRQGGLSIVLEVMAEPMFLLLVGCAALYFVLGDAAEAAVLAALVLVVITITLVQRAKTERSLEALRDLSSPRATVLRDGHVVRVAGREVVRGDLLVLAEGDRVPADGVVVSSADLLVDESLLTGESLPVGKRAADDGAAPQSPTQQDSHTVFSGTLVVAGRALVRVAAVGAATEIGRIGRALRDIDTRATPLQAQTDRVVRKLAAGGIAVALGAVAVFGATRGDWTGGLLAGIALAMSLLPEEFPVVLTVFLAIGAWRMSQRAVLTRRMAAIEALGAATVLCVDKTGTLTENRMTVQRLVLPDGTVADPRSLAAAPDALHALAHAAILACAPDPFDPMERAIHALRPGSGGVDVEHGAPVAASLVRRWPLTPQRLALTHAWADVAETVVAAKGAPEAIAQLTGLSGEGLATMRAAVDAAAVDGLRLLGVAIARSAGPAEALPEDPHALGLRYIGLIALADPLRAEVPDAVRACRSAGVRVLMITGDHPSTAAAIARAAGLAEADSVLTGPEIAGLSELALAHRLKRAGVIARAAPEQKLRIVSALQAHGDTVAMTGDGVNDAPALRAADIGIAMGGRGTDVAREAAAMVLTDDHFASIVHAIRLGRRIFDNLRKATIYIIAVHVEIVGAALLPIAANWPLLLLPVHIAFLELVIDPACSVAFEAEPEEPDTMRRPPRPQDEGLFERAAAQSGLLQGGVALAGVLAVYLGARGAGLADDAVRALAFSTVVLANLALIVANRSSARSLAGTLRTPNRPFWWVLAGAVVALVATIALPPIRGLFAFALPPAAWMAAPPAAALALLATIEAIERMQRRRGTAAATT